jgi:hypothetical protein
MPLGGHAPTGDMHDAGKVANSQKISLQVETKRPFHGISRMLVAYHRLECVVVGGVRAVADTPVSFKFARQLAAQSESDGNGTRCQ